MVVMVVASAAAPAAPSPPMVVMISGRSVVFRIVLIAATVRVILPMMTAKSIRTIASGILTVSAAATALASSACSVVA